MDNQSQSKWYMLKELFPTEFNVVIMNGKVEKRASSAFKKEGNKNGKKRRPAYAKSL